ncbi:MAG: transposase [Geminicoccaceae bacterium]|nr:transposase [Geminicoccaceae bacterium]
MPFKHNAARRHRIPQARYRVRNWPHYDAGLRRRGSLTLWLDEAALVGWQAPRRATPGGQVRVAGLAIELVLMLRLVFHLALRQAGGFVSSVLRLLELRVPDHRSGRRRSMAGPAGPGASLYGALHVKRSSLVPRSDVSLCAARPSGDGGVAVGGKLAIGGADLAPRACIRRVLRDPNHDAAMRIGGEAPGRRAHSAPRLGGQARFETQDLRATARSARIVSRRRAARGTAASSTRRCGRPGAGPAAGPESGGRSTARSWRRQRSGRRGRSCGRTGIIRRICGRGTPAPSDLPRLSP